MQLSDKVKEICKDIINNKQVKQSKKNKIINDFKEEWGNIMFLSNLYNKYFDTYSLNNIEFKEYGIKSDIYIVPPLTYNSLEEKRVMLEENLNCSIIFNHTKSSKWINSRFIFNQNKNKKFEIIKTKSCYDIYIGNDYSGNPIISDIRKYSHILVSGTTRSGKSKLTDCILSNLIINNKPQDLKLILIQVAKSDLCLYEDLEHTMAFADDLEKTRIVLKHIVETIIPDRDNRIRPYRKRAMLDNAYEYNILKKGIDSMPMILIVFDEMASLFDTKGNSKYVIDLKLEIEGYIQAIAQYGASNSVFLLSSVQRPTANLLPSFIKAMSNINISFKQANRKSSEVATDDSNIALGLKQREFVYNFDKWDYGIVPLISNQEIYKLIKPYLKPNHRTLFDDLQKMNNRDGIKKHKSLINIGTHFKTEDEILEENIKKIKNYVPYDQNNKILIEENKGRRKLK